MRKLPYQPPAFSVRHLVDPAMIGSEPSGTATYSSVESAPTPCASPTASENSDTLNQSPRKGRNSVPKSSPASVAADSTVAIAAGEEQPRKSAAIQHTKFFCIDEKPNGLKYEKRMCRYCTAVFSFKGSTTSAPLRHLKKMHPEKLQESHSAAASPRREVRSSSDSDIVQDGDRSNEAVNTEGLEPDVDAVVPVLNEHNSMLTFSSPRTSHIPSFTLKRKRDDREMVTTLRNMASSSETTSADRRESRNEYGVQQDTTQRNNDIGMRSKHTDSPKLTASQRAIAHFLENYDEELPVPAMRLRFAKHLTHNVPEAEMYNVLDPATQLEFVREFGHLPPASSS